MPSPSGGCGFVRSESEENHALKPSRNPQLPVPAHWVSVMDATLELPGHEESELIGISEGSIHGSRAMLRLTSTLGVLLLAGTIIASSSREALAQRGSGLYRSRINQAAKNVRKDIAAVQKQLKEAQDELSRSSKDLKQAQASYKDAQSDVERAKKSLTERLGAKVGLPAAVTAAEQAHSDYEKATAKAAGQLRNTPKYQEVKQKLDEAEARVETLRHGANSEGRSKDRLAEASKAALQAREAYRSLLDSDPQVKLMREKVDRAEERLKEVRGKLQQEIKHDSDLRSAETLFRQSKAALEQAQNSVAAGEQKVAQLQSRLAADQRMIGK